MSGVPLGAAANRVGLPLSGRAAALARGAAGLMRAPTLLSRALRSRPGSFYVAIDSRHSLERYGVHDTASAGAVAAPRKGAIASSMDAEVAGFEARLAREGGTPQSFT